MSLAPERVSIGLRRLFTSPGVDPYDEVVWERRDARISNWKDGTVAFEQRDVEFPVVVVGERHQHRRPEVLPRHARHAGAGDVAASGRRPRRRHHHPVGHRGRVLRRRRRGRGVQRRAEVHPRHPAGGVQQPGVVQHRRQGRAAAGERVLHPRRRRHDERDPQLVPRGRRDLQGRLGLGHQPVEDPLERRAARGRRHRVGSGELHARRRRVGGHDQVGRQDPTGGEDGHPQRRPSRRRGVHLVQGQRGAQGAGAARRRLRHGPRRRRLVLDPVPERQQLGARHRRVHAGGHRGRRLGAEGRHHRRGREDHPRPRPVASDRAGGVGLRRPWNRSSTPRSTSGTPRTRRDASTEAIHVSRRTRWCTPTRV